MPARTSPASPLNPAALVQQLAIADLPEAFALALEVAAQPLARQADLLLSSGVLFALHRQLRHVLPSDSMRPQGAAPLAFALYALKEALLRERDARRRVVHAHEVIDSLLVRKGWRCIGRRIAVLHGLEAMDMAVQGFIALVEVCASILRDRDFVMARLGIGAGWFGGETGVAARLGRAGFYGSGGHISRARFAILRNDLLRGDEIKRPAPGLEPVLDAAWLRREFQRDARRDEPEPEVCVPSVQRPMNWAR
ncbi:hypothetical protein CCU68_16410 [Pseudomonas gingeri NCPPB 3146 = LMG 5327]|uniref:Uncharacterized protein n=2 Tax=Pseudomonas gingeri TaxID=117681 RepID=A0A7Y7Y2J1_9PSED|nr:MULTISPECIES: hypothetical protein [Pseudomonas]NWC15893.1 hypothetical protein [Pseudomonas gingeri]NWE45969.1 hypothetical protein [Pseudomonas gingeri]NWE69275.1 hypothetical protein [Pseudomonas gingeri]PNQ91449.1 hypothetical protein CCU68_16410 [Pseudomonas gingeri NCPPB 3146 = LMG 5327]BBP75398.1 hypothetical protein PHLH7_15020 [Pseudomonas sp. Ost2]